jgi:hypothetical protein
VPLLSARLAHLKRTQAYAAYLSLLIAVVGYYVLICLPWLPGELAQAKLLLNGQLQ